MRQSAHQAGRHRGRKRLAWLMCTALVVVSGVSCSCNSDQPASDGPDSSASPSPAPRSTPPPPIEIELPIATGLENGWMVIDTVDDAHQRAWAEGERVGDDKMIIQTSNVRRFQLDLSKLNLNWKKRAVLRIDGYNRELTRKHWPVLTYERNSTGAWEPTDDDSPQPKPPTKTPPDKPQTEPSPESQR